MAGGGPAPKTNAVRRNKQITVELSGEAVEAPKLFKRNRYSTATQRWWHTWAGSPQAEAFLDTDGGRLQILAQPPYKATKVPPAPWGRTGPHVVCLTGSGLDWPAGRNSNSRRRRALRQRDRPHSSGPRSTRGRSICGSAANCLAWLCRALGLLRGRRRDARMLTSTRPASARARVPS
ncbi:phage terminase small subunit [Nonomuraea africana]